MKVVALPEVRIYLEDLVHKLYLSHYFGFKESAQAYVDRLWVDIETNLPYHSYKMATPYFDRFGKGMLYASFRKNRRTCWYVFFDVYSDDNDETVYLVRLIGNNHTMAQYL